MATIQYLCQLPFGIFPGHLNVEGFISSTENRRNINFL